MAFTSACVSVRVEIRSTASHALSVPSRQIQVPAGVAAVVVGATSHQLPAYVHSFDCG